MSALLLGLTLAVAPPGATAEPRGHRMVVAGVALVCLGVAAYVVTGAGLVLRTQPEQRELGTGLALGGGVSASVLVASGIPLIVFGRRRAQASLQSEPAAAGLGLRLRF